MEEDSAFDSTGQVAEETTQRTALASLLTTPNLLVAGLAILSILLLLAIARGRNSKSQKTRSEIQTATWGIRRPLGYTTRQRYLLRHARPDGFTV